MAWAGTGVLWTISGGVLSSQAFGKNTASAAKGELNFVQISDSHIGFNKPANPDVSATLQATVDKINALQHAPEFIIHTGDISHTAKAAEFDSLEGILKGANQKQVFYVPGEHDIAVDDAKQYLERFGKGSRGRGWYSFDQKGVHFVGLVNVGALEGMGKLGADQLEWLEDDLRGKSASTPIVLFAHIPLWAVYPEWGWSTQDSEQALGYVKHIHQVMQKVEGNVTFHTAMSTAFPQPAPGSAPAPGPMKVPAEKLRGVLGLASVQYLVKKHSLAVVDSSLA
jgi:predicted phosphodiesterase